MKFSCIKENLEHAVSIAERFTGKSLNLPILGNILIEAEDGNLSVASTNLESAVKIYVNGKSQKNGRVTIPAKILSPLLQSVKKEEKIDVEEKQGNILIKTDTRDIKINGTPPDDFPLIPKIKKSVGFAVDGFDLSRGLEKVIPAVSNSEFKPELSGVYFKASGSRLCLAATDTFRLAEKNVNLEKKVDGETISFILPQRVSQELSRIFGSEGDTVKIFFGENQVAFETDKIKIISRLIDGSFPEYSNIVPKEFELTSFINRREFNDAVKSSGIFASKLQEVNLKFRSKEVEVTSLNSEVGEYKTSIPVSATGNPVSLSFNYRYLLDGLNVLDGEEMFFGLNSEQKPSILKNKDDNSFFYVVMPIRLS